MQPFKQAPTPAPLSTGFRYKRVTAMQHLRFRLAGFPIGKTHNSPVLIGRDQHRPPL
jgi:hypothetical protein